MECCKVKVLKVECLLMEKECWVGLKVLRGWGWYDENEKDC